MHIYIYNSPTNFNKYMINHIYSPSTQQHQTYNSHQVHKQLWLISTLCNAPKQDTYMHVVPNHLQGRHPWCQLNIINNPNNWIQRILQQHFMMHEHMTQSTTMHVFTQLQQSTSTFSWHPYTTNSTSLHVWKSTNNIYAHIHI